MRDTENRVSILLFFVLVNVPSVKHQNMEPQSHPHNAEYQVRNQLIKNVNGFGTCMAWFGATIMVV